MHRYLLLCLLVFSCMAIADDTASQDTADMETPAEPEAPDLPLPVQDGEPMAADITITRKGNKTIQEYRVNGKIYKIKVIPDVGPAYYFIDPDGDGEMQEVSASDLDRLIKVNQWSIFSW